MTFLQLQQPASTPLIIPSKPNIPILSATAGTGPCLTMRTYRITARDMESNSPKPSSYSTCTPAAANAFKSAAAPLPK